MQKILAFTFLWCLFLPGTSKGEMNVSKCSSLLGSFSRFYDSTTDYLAEVKKTRGLALVKTEPKNDNLDRRAFGLLTEAPANSKGSLLRPINSTVREATELALGKPYNLTVLEAIQRPFKLSKLSIILAMTLVSLTGQTYYNYAIEGRETRYDTFINEDFRYNSIHQDEMNLKLDPTKARWEANTLRKEQKAYLEYLQDQYKIEYLSDPQSADENLIENDTFGKVFFSDLKKLKESGISEHQEGYFYTTEFKPKLDALTFDTLVQIRNMTQEEMELVFILVNDSPGLDKIRQKVELSPLLLEIESDSFTKKLTSLFENKTITKGQLLESLQKDIFWKGRLKELSTMGLKKKKMVGGVWSDQILTVEDLRAEILQDLI